MVQKKNKNYRSVFSNSIMKSGKGHLSENLVVGLLKDIQKKTKKNGILVLKLSFKNILVPVSVIEINRRNRKNKNSIPFILPKEKRIPKIIKYICSNDLKLKRNVFLNEILKLAENRGSIKNYLKSKNQISFLNKGFSHFRWF